MRYSDFINIYDVYEYPAPGVLTIKKDDYVFYNVCTVFSDEFIKMSNEFMKSNPPGIYELVGGEFLTTAVCPPLIHKCTLAEWKHRETLTWIEGVNHMPFWMTILEYCDDSKMRRKITTGMYVPPEDFIHLVLNSLEKAGRIYWMN